MGTLERRETLTHKLGPAGRVTVKSVTGLMRIRGIEGEEAHVTVNYRIRAADQASAEWALDSGRVAIDRGPGSLSIETPERRLATGLAWLFAGGRVSAEIVVEVPWGTQVRLETMSGSIEAVNLTGEQKYRTVSGDVRLWSLGGVVEAGTISGGVTLDGGTALRFRGNTISGGIKARAGVFHSLNLSTTSGSMIVVGTLDPAGEHRAESISGGMTLTPVGGVSAELKTVSGSISSELDHRTDGTRGFWRVVVGDGRAQLRFNSTSGSLRLMAPRPADVAAAQAAAPSQPATAAPTQAAAAPAPESTTPQPAADVPDGSAETWNPDEAGVDAGEVARDQAAQDEMAVLQALERGEIGVDEAADRLERARKADEDVR